MAMQLTSMEKDTWKVKARVISLCDAINLDNNELISLGTIRDEESIQNWLDRHCSWPPTWWWVHHAAASWVERRLSTAGRHAAPMQRHVRSLPYSRASRCRCSQPWSSASRRTCDGFLGHHVHIWFPVISSKGDQSIGEAINGCLWLSLGNQNYFPGPLLDTGYCLQLLMFQAMLTENVLMLWTLFTWSCRIYG